MNTWRDVSVGTEVADYVGVLISLWLFLFFFLFFFIFTSEVGILVLRPLLKNQINKSKK
jgi:hypothetical protein